VGCKGSKKQGVGNREQGIEKPLSHLQNNQESGITYSVAPLGLWFVPTAKLVLYGPTPTRILDANSLFS
jgi:hypothetical protein